MTQYVRDTIAKAGAKDVTQVYWGIRLAVEAHGEDLAAVLEIYKRNRPEQFYRNA